MRRFQTRTGPPDGARERVDGLILADDAPMQFFFDPREPLHFFFFDRVDGNACPARNHIFDIGFGHNAHARGFADIELLPNIAQVLTLELLLVLVMLGLFEVLARDRAFHPRDDELDPPLDVGHFRRQRCLAKLDTRAGFIEKVDGFVG